MNLGEAKKKALSLMAEYSIDGVPIPDGENADYLNRMNRFANDAQFEISNKVGISSSHTFTQTATSEEGYNKYPLPVDFKDHRYMNYKDERFRDYRIENGSVLLKKIYSGTYELFYYKNPTELTPETSDAYQFEVDLHTQHLIPYFIGGMILQDENVTLANQLLNLYYNKLSAIKEKKDEYPNEIETVFRI